MIRWRMRRLAWMFAAALALPACSKKAEEAAPPPPTTTTTTTPALSPAAEEAQNLFATVCATCHGKGGQGDGPAAQALNPKPRNYTDKAWQASVKDEEIKKIILEGGMAVGKSPVMPAQPQLTDKPDVLDELVKIIRGFAR